MVVIQQSTSADIDTVLSNDCPFYPHTLKKLWLGVTASLNYIIQLKDILNVQ